MKPEEKERRKALVLSNCNDSDTLSGIAELTGTSRKFVKKVLEESGFDFSKLLRTRGRLPEDKHVLVKGATRRGTVRNYVKTHNLLEELCSECQIGPEWNGRPLTLQLDHIDGDSSNNILDNLRYLCPNCHSQTDTFCGRNVRRE